MRKVLWSLSLLVLLLNTLLTPITYAWEYEEILETSSDTVTEEVVEENGEEDMAPEFSVEEENDEEDIESDIEEDEETTEESEDVEEWTWDIIEEWTWENEEIGTGEILEIMTWEDVELITWTLIEEGTWTEEELTWSTLGGWTGTWEESVENIKYNEEPIIWEKTYDNVTVKVEALSWTFPEWTEVTIEPIKWWSLRSLKNQLVEEEEEIKKDTTVVAFDITFIYSWEEVQPKEWEKVKVTFDYSNNEDLVEAEEQEDKEVKVYHIEDKDEEWNKVEKGEEKIEKIVINEEKSEEVDNWVVVEAEKFSTYVLVVAESTPTITIYGSWWVISESSTISFECEDSICTWTITPEADVITLPTMTKENAVFLWWVWTDLTTMTKSVSFNSSDVTSDRWYKAKWTCDYGYIDNWDECVELTSSDKGISYDSESQTITVWWNGLKYTIQDRNVGATMTWWVNGIGNHGAQWKHFQWWNNNGVYYRWWTKPTSKWAWVSVESTYIPSLYSGLLVNTTTSNVYKYNDTTSQTLSWYYNLWWWLSPVWDWVARKGPCPEGYHVPSRLEVNNLLDVWANVLWYDNKNTSNFINAFSNALYIPHTYWVYYWNRNSWNNDYVFWANELKSQNISYGLIMYDGTNVTDGSTKDDRTYLRRLNPIRCFQNYAKCTPSQHKNWLNCDDDVVEISCGEVENGIWIWTKEWNWNSYDELCSESDIICNENYTRLWNQCLLWNIISFDTDWWTSIASQSVQSWSTWSIPDVIPTKDWYSFAWWYWTWLQTEFNFTWTIITWDITIYAKWNLENYTITYHLNWWTWLDNTWTYTIETDTFTLNNPSKINYVFAWWTGTDLSSATNTLTIAKWSFWNREYYATYSCEFWTYQDWKCVETRNEDGSINFEKWQFKEKVVDLSVPEYGNKIIILDRNLWAISSGTTCSIANPLACWFYYQWWNNYWFTWGDIISKEGQVDASAYWPSNSYLSWTFLFWSNNWDSSSNSNLWWWSSLDSWDSVRQWPCPDGYHIPTSNEWNEVLSLFNIWSVSSLWTSYCDWFSSKANCFSEKFWLPFAGYRLWNSWNRNDLGVFMEYWAANQLDENHWYRIFSKVDYPAPAYLGNEVKTYGYSVRCFKDSASKNLVLVSSWDYDLGIQSTVRWREDWEALPIPVYTWYYFEWWYTTPWYGEGTRVTTNAIADYSDNDTVTLYAKWRDVRAVKVTYDVNWWYFPWDSDKTKERTYEESNTTSWDYIIVTTNWETPSKAWFMFDGWYLTWLTTRWTWYLEDDITVYAKWLPFEDYNVKLSDDITITIMDRNIWATAAGTGCSDSDLSTCWYHFQWWNNYWFAHSWNWQIFPNWETITSIMATDWEGSNWIYYNSKYILNNAWNSWYSAWDRLRWNRYNSTDEVQWPCPDGYHIPLRYEWKTIWTLLGWTLSWNIIRDTLNLPFAGFREINGQKANLKGLWSHWRYFTSNPEGWYPDRVYSLHFGNNWWWSDSWSQNVYSKKWDWYSIRCFKDTEVKNINYEKNWWTLNTNNKKTTRWYWTPLTLEKPTRSNSIFSWWYTTSWYVEWTKVSTTYIESDEDEITLYARWECEEWYHSSDDWNSCINEIVTITYDAQSHSWTIGSQSIKQVQVESGSIVQLTWNESETAVSEKWWYRFIGWTTERWWITPINEYTAESDVTLYPIFKKDSVQYTVTFSWNWATLNWNEGLEITQPCVIEAEYNTWDQASTCKIVTPTIQRAWYEIKWYNESKTHKDTCSIVWNQELEIDGNKTYYAITKKDLQAIFDRNWNTAQTKYWATESTTEDIEEICSIWNEETECTVHTPTIIPTEGKTSIWYTTSSISSWENLTWENAGIVLTTEPITYYAWTKSTPIEITVNYIYWTWIISRLITSWFCTPEVRYNQDETLTWCLIALPVVEARTGYAVPKWYRWETEAVETDSENKSMFYYSESPLTLTAKAEMSWTIAYVVKHYFQTLENNSWTNKYQLNASITDSWLSGEVDTILVLSWLKKEIEWFTYYKATVNWKPVNDIIDINQEIVYAETHQLTTPVEIELLYTRNRYQYTLNSVANVSTEWSTESINAFYGQAIILSWWVTSDCYERSWWQGLPNGVGNTQQTLFIMPSHSVTITPEIIEKTYTIEFNANAADAEWIVAPINVSCLSSIQLSWDKVYTRNGYLFQNWNTKEDWKWTSYEKTATITTPLTKTGGATVILYAQWSGENYIVTFDANSWAVTETTRQVTYNGKYGDLPVPTREWYQFTWWYTERIWWELVTWTDTVRTASNHTLYAQWKVNAYTVSFDANNWEVMPLSKEVIYDAVYWELPIPNRTGYTFQWWYTEKDWWTKIISTDKVEIASNHKLYAHWIENHYRIEFNANGWEWTMDSVENIQYTAVTTLPENTFTRNGYRFIWWSRISTSTVKEFEDEATVKELTAEDWATVTLSALWSKWSYTISYELNGWTLTGWKTNPESYDVDTETFTLNNPEKKGYTFLGWSWTDLTTLTTGVTIAQWSIWDRKYEANWSLKTYTITWKNSTWTVLEKDENVPYWTMPSYDWAEPTSWANVQYTYTFNWWNSEIATVTQDQVYTAVYTQTINTYPITWKDEDGTEIEIVQVPYWETPSYTWPELTKTWHSFSTWTPTPVAVDWEATYTATYTINQYRVTPEKWVGVAEILWWWSYDYGTIITLTWVAKEWYHFSWWLTETGIEITVPANNITVKFTAHPNTYYIKFKPNGWTWEMEDQEFVYDQTQALNANAYTRSWFTFISWTDGEWWYYYDKSEVKNLATTWVITLIAQWLEWTIPDPQPLPTPVVPSWSSSGWWRRIKPVEQEHGSAETDIKETIDAETQTWTNETIDTGINNQITGDTQTTIQRTEEELTAYQYAYKYWITTLAPKEAARPDEYVQRWHMAKMVVNYALNVLHRKLPEKTPKECRWLDGKSAWESQEIKDYAVKACALWLMWIDMKYFQPYKLVTRAQFGTIIWRLLWWKLVSNPYYARHLSRLKENWIMTQIDNPEDRIEIRKRAWLMFMRSEKYFKVK